jgi:7-carboxy-7-deazaguanine synthase
VDTVLTDEEARKASTWAWMAAEISGVVGIAGTATVVPMISPMSRLLLFDVLMRITEIYKSIQGESTYAGRPCVFIRTTGCNLRCTWCDSTFTFYGGQEMSLDEILGQVRGYHCKLIELTGGEPLLQKEAKALVHRLLDEGHTVLIETSGSLDIRGVDARAVLIMDIKCPGSGMTEAMRWENIEALKPTDQVKFVIKDRQDYLWAVEVLNRYQLPRRFTVLFSPVFGVMDPKQLAEWVLEDGLAVQLQLQLHKYIWHPEARGV